MPWSWFRRRKNALRPQQFKHVMLGQRRFRADAPYLLPDDMGEVNRLDFQHFMLRYAMRGIFVAPLPGPPTSILDVGCGTGRWMREVGAIFPDAAIIGLDIKDALPSADPLPDGMSYIKGNVLERLPFNDRSFVYVHQRFLNGGIPVQSWPHAVEELIRVTQEGGWIEQGEPGIAEQAGPMLTQLNQWLEQIVSKRGIDLHFGPHIGELMTNLGLERVQLFQIALPLGQYGGRLGSMAETDYFTALDALKGAVAQFGITTEVTFQQVMDAARQEVASGQAIWPFYFAVGRRPYR